MMPRRSHLAENSTLKFVPGSRYVRRYDDTWTLLSTSSTVTVLSESFVAHSQGYGFPAAVADGAQG